MTDGDLTRTLEDWFDDGPDMLPDRSVDAILATVERTAQRRRWHIGWGRGDGHASSSRLALGLGLAATLLVGGYVVSVGQPTPTDGNVAPSPSPTRPPGSDPASAAVRGVVPGTGVATDVGTIVFGMETGSGPALLTIRPDGSGLRELVGPSTCCAMLSPDGGTVLFETDQTDETLRAQVRWYGAAPAFAPTGVGQGFSEAWTPTQGGSNLGVTLRPGAWWGGDVAFEGRALTDPARNGIYLSLDNGGALLLGDIVRMTGAPDGQRDIPIAFSPDGSRLLFVRDSGIDAQIGRLGDLYVIDKGAIGGSGASGQSRYRPGVMKRLNPEGTLVAASEAFGSGASWAPDGGRVAFAAFDTADGGFTSASRAYVADVATGTATPITDTTTHMTSAHWSPDGTWIAFDIADSNGATRDVWLARPDGTQQRRLAQFAGGSCCAVWSPDSTWLLAQGSDGGGGGLFILGLDGSVARLASVDDPNDLRFYSWGGWASQP